VGLVRAFVQVTEHRIGTPEERRRLVSIDLEHAHATVVVPTTTELSSSAVAGTVPTAITVKATSPGLASATIEIPVSVQSEHGVLQAASRSLEYEQRWV
jgi:hypothetical protein